MLLGSLIASFALGTLVAYIALEALPCHWFGTAFEGACAYGVLYTSIGIGLAVVGAVAFLMGAVAIERETRRVEWKMTGT